MLKKIAVFVALVAIFAVYQFDRFVTNEGPLLETSYVLIDKGSGSKIVAQKLVEAGVIDKPLVFRILGRLNGLDRKLKAGEYQFSSKISMIEAMKQIASGDVYYRRITFPEGSTTKQFLDILSEEEFLSGEITLLPKDGDLLPETYSFERGTTRDEIIKQALTAMEKVKKEVWDSRSEGVPLKNMEEMMVLASIIEKETAVASERGLVASVFANRLLKGMKLQTDPTVIYAITKGQQELGRLLTRKDLQMDDKYNTYFYYGLPPAPICNPSKASIEAAASPEASPFLYFVADGKGGHNFSTSLSEHNKNVQDWKDGLKNR